MTDSLFLYKNFSLSEDRRVASFYFSITHKGEIHDLVETITFPVELPDRLAVQSALRALHLALGVSYYKIFVCSTISHPYQMNQEESGFWNTVFENGLGEFLYVNKLDRERLAKFVPQEDGYTFDIDVDWRPDNKALLGIGGGKDSIVAGELLKKAGTPLEGFVMATGEQLGQTQSVADTMRIPLNVVGRQLDIKLLKLQERPDAYKGHIPISMIFGLVGGVLAVAKNASYVVVANESSASIPRAKWQGSDINHQWSKSFEFETLLQKYLHRNISTRLTYFSAVRPLSSVAISRLFATLSQYFEIFTSDNSIFRIDPSKRPSGRWSLESPKSLSSFILLAPWMTEADIIRTFGRNFLDEPSLEALFYNLIGLEGEQPLDCVGTEEELLLSLNLLYRQNKFTSAALVRRALERQAISDNNLDEELNKSLQLANEHAIPEDIYSRLKPLMHISNSLLKMIDGKDVIFAGVGQGRSINGVEEFLRNHTNILSFTGVDRSKEDDSFRFLTDFDQAKTVFIKNEGIPGSEMPVPYITPMQLFFEFANQKNIMTVGITGTKGKSTTTALTAHILKEGGKDVVLAGNIGISPLQALENTRQDTIFVLELSSYQLSDLTASPHISACLNLYNDHSDWHGSVEAYYEAKHNIMRYTEDDDVFIFNPDFAQIQEWVESAKCKTVAINTREEFDLSQSKLFGDHNKLNALIAKKIAQQFGITDKEIHAAVNTFEPLQHRMQVVREKGGITYIDDAIGMTPESTLASLQAVHDKFGSIGCLLLGGQDRNYDFVSLMRTIASLQIPYLVLFPDTAEKMKESLPDSYNPRILETASMDEAVVFASKHAPDGSVVLLSTAAPSYSLWRDFEEKGSHFQTAVKNL